MNPMAPRNTTKEGRDTIKSAVAAKLPVRNRAADNTLNYRAQPVAGKAAIDRTKLPPKVQY